MSMARQLKRQMERDNLKKRGLRSTCRKCGGKMLHKSGYGWVCKRCGWTQKGK